MTALTQALFRPEPVPWGTAPPRLVGHGPLTTEAMVFSGTGTGDVTMNTEALKNDDLTHAELHTIAGGMPDFTGRSEKEIRQMLEQWYRNPLHPIASR